MIRSKAANQEIHTIDEAVKKTSDVSDLLKLLVKAVTVLTKLVRDIRTNQTTTMRAQNIELIKETPEEKKETN